MKTKFYNKMTTRILILLCIPFIGEKINAQPAVISHPMAIGQDCNRTSGNNFKVLDYSAGALTSIFNCNPSLAGGFSPGGGSIAFSPVDQKVYYIKTTTGNNSIVYNWAPNFCPVSNQAPVYTYASTFIVGLEYNALTGEGYQVEFGPTAPYDIFLRNVTSYAPLITGPSIKINLPPGVKIYQQNGDVVMTPSGQMYFIFNNKLFNLDYSPYPGALNATYIDTVKGLGSGVNLIGLSYYNGKLVGAATNNGLTCIYREIDFSSVPITLSPIIPPVGSTAIRTFSTYDMASLITGIGVAEKVSAASQTGATTYQVTYDIKLKNFGNVNLTNVQLTDNMLTTFGASFVNASVAAVGTLPAGLTINGSYNGNTITNIFAAGGTMKATPKDSAIVRITVNLNNPTLNIFYNNSAQATAAGLFFSTSVSDLSDDQLGLNPDPDSNDVPDDSGEDTPTPLRLSDWIIVLPLKIIDFNGQANSKAVDLNWKLINDEAGLQMNIQRSSDGNNFTTIKTQNAEVSADIKKYTWTDNSSSEGVSFYRIQFVQPSGKTIYTDVIKIDKGRIVVAELRASPVPFSEELNINFRADKNERVTCHLTDLNGKVVYKKDILATKGENNFTLDNLSSIPGGNYILRVNTSQKIYNKVITKVR